MEIDEVFIATVKEDLEKTGTAEINKDLLLKTDKAMLEEQKKWDADDPCHSMDFSENPVWLLAGEEYAPEGFNSVEDAIVFIEDLRKRGLV